MKKETPCTDRTAPGCTEVADVRVNGVHVCLVCAIAHAERHLARLYSLRNFDDLHTPKIRCRRCNTPNFRSALDLDKVCASCTDSVRAYCGNFEEVLGNG